jgi:hypothetical protein
MAATVLAVDSTWDDATQIASQYRRTFVYPVLDQSGLPVTELKDADANAQEAQQGASNPSVRYLTGVSHGKSDTFTGDQDCSVFTTGSIDPTWTRGKVIHFLACNTALFLGPNMVDPNAGAAAAFFGYKGLFTWPSDQNSQYAAMFFDCDAEIDRCLASGTNAGTALTNCIAKYTQTISNLKQAGDPLSLRLAATLQANLNLLCGPNGTNGFGDPQATIK